MYFFPASIASDLATDRRRVASTQEIMEQVGSSLWPVLSSQLPKSFQEFKILDEKPTGHSWVRDFYTSPGDPYMQELFQMDHCCQQIPQETTTARVRLERLILIPVHRTRLH